MSENLNKGHRERMRSRFKRGGMEAMADHEIIELLLYYAIPRRDTNKLAHRIMREFGGLHNVFEAGVEEIRKRCGLSENTATLLSMMAPLARRYDISKWGRRISFASTKSLAQYASSLFIGRTVECFYLLCLDNRAALTSATELTRGTLDRAELYPREIMKCVMACDAAYVVLAHNHPSGSLDISEADVQTTRRLVSMLAEVEVGVLDHIICGGKGYVSFADKRIMGLLGIENIAKK
ncbi:MAG: DNA repair protein RadC [Clostridiales bacterium]|jgi:DNA repair protein RadC|nr:DNA repair protein RadC [Clostridiales bacterium]